MHPTSTTGIAPALRGGAMAVRAAVLLLSASQLLACAADLGDSPSAVEVEQALTTTLREDFEAYPAGPLPAPWTITAAGTSTVRVVATTDHGKVALLQGGTGPDYVIASRSVSSSDPVMHLQLLVNPAPGASFIFGLHGAGSSIGARRIRLQRWSSDMLAANTTPFGTHDCGVLPSGVWSTLGLDVRTDTDTFDVTINGAATACMGGATGIGTPWNSVSIMDASNEGFGGAVQFDDIVLTGDAAPVCTPPATPPTTVLSTNFDSDPLGALRSPWSVSPNPEGRSTLRVVSVSGHGRSLQLHGSTLSGDFVIGSRDFSSNQTDARFDFAVRPSTGAEFVVEFKGAGGSIGARRIRLQRASGSTALVANTAGFGDITCGTLSSSAWSSVSLTVHTQRSPHTFDVTINGASTACTGTVTQMGTPFTGINVMDASNSGWGGDVVFDDMVVTGLGAPAGSCP